MTRKLFPPLFLLFSLFSVTLRAETIIIASGAGYKRPLMEIAGKYEKKTGRHIDAVFGNMQQIITQAQMSGNVSIIFGDKSFFDQSAISFAGYYPVGEGKLVLAWRKGLQVKRITDIREKRIARLGIPDEKKAIYGRVASEYLEKSGLSGAVKGKLLVVSTVPQVSAYLVSGEIDAGFINITDAIGIQENIGGYLVAGQSLYTPIHIQAGVVKGFEGRSDIRDFLQFLKEKESVAVLHHYGL
ncbi:molybdate ABC transporter substrate-binding protein [Chlorobium phaeobacteroides]|uniref:Molybdenum ABC transporter, periplasmic molybdate-binding protein n=1 Tax=Chlorobium phaeobacteroides (strain DSM 266 / SMG 266 / 2430) TaxID=290317 RepID=A1BDM2_CHLPD|nr:molybdate ABC transporter substrate-binding protein [Chlorobium phaeobacteroides]ABL64499.1 molybdenum ABC transporter, periplasmic molybdate-binding protein [Chlorobium phaeobacteroides DSM 266]